MATTNPTGKNACSNVRPRYVYLGEDADGGTHLYRTVDETIFALTADGRREYRFDLDGGQTVDHYVAHVTDMRGWYNLTYGLETFLDGFEQVL